MEMQSLVGRCLVMLSCCSVLACGADEIQSDSADDVGESADSDSMTTSDGSESSDSADSTGSSESAESDDSVDSSDTSESTTDDEPMSDMGTEPDPNDQIPPPDEEGCHAIYAQDLLPTYELEITDAVWDQLIWEWNNGQINEDLQDMGLDVDPTPYHPIKEFRYGDIVIYDAEIRLRGNPSNWDPIAVEGPPGEKMQFQISFDENDKDGRFLGLRKLALDAHTFNRHMLRDRLALAIMRDVGIAAPCANNARLVINDEYYGIFTNIEKIDDVFLERVFEDPSGDLWKRANWQLKTNEDTGTTTRLNALKGADTPAELYTYFNLDQALRVYAAEAVLPDGDGAWAGGLNFYLYDDPMGGKFLLLPWDLDGTFEYFNDPQDGEYPLNPDPIAWEKPTTHGRPWYDLALQDLEWRAYYIDMVDEIAHEGYVPAKLHERIDTWTAQIEDAVVEDVNKPYSNTTYYNKVQELHDYVDARSAYLDTWVICTEQGGVLDLTNSCIVP